MHYPLYYTSWTNDILIGLCCLHFNKIFQNVGSGVWLENLAGKFGKIFILSYQPDRNTKIFEEKYHHIP